MGVSESQDTFESQLGKLEEICEKMGGDALSLSEGLVLYEQGARLVQELEGQLKHAERKVERLLNNDFTDIDAKPQTQLFEEPDAAEQPE